MGYLGAQGTRGTSTPGHCHHIAQKISRKHGPHVYIQIASRKDKYLVQCEKWIYYPVLYQSIVKDPHL